MKVSRNLLPGDPPGPDPGRAALRHSGGPLLGQSTQRSRQKRADLGKKQQSWAGAPAGSLLSTGCLSIRQVTDRLGWTWF